MGLVSRYEIQHETDGSIITLYINTQTSEFSQELHEKNPIEDKTFMEQIQSYISKCFPDQKIKLIKLMIGSVLIGTLSLSGVASAEASTVTAVSTQAISNSYTVVAGDTLWIIANKFEITVTELKSANNLISDTINIGQVLIIPQKAEAANYTNYKVTSGDSLYLIAKKFNTTIAAIKSLNKLNTEMIYVGQLLKIPAITTSTTASTYTIVSGDTLWSISNKYNTTIAALKTANNLTSDILYIGQVLKIPTATAASSTAPYITYITHKVASGDNPWNLSIKYGIPMTELLSTNGFTQSTVLSIGQSIRIPIHNVPIIPTLGAKYGERLDWWTQAQYVIPINKVFKVIDFATGRSFNIKRTIGANHADCEPMTATDAHIIKEVWGGAYSWTARAVIIEVDGRRIAASMASMPHDIQYITGNDFNGHFDIHFYNSTRHKDGLVDTDHQRQINIAAGYVQI